MLIGVVCEANRPIGHGCDPGLWPALRPSCSLGVFWEGGLAGGESGKPRNLPTSTVDPCPEKR